MVSKIKIGPSFGDELAAANLGGLPMSWGADGSLSMDALTDDQRAKVQVVLDAHDPTATDGIAAWTAFRAQRDALLAASDWTQLADVPDAIKSAWTTYRQQLRDLPANTKNPAKVNWPSAPK